MIKRKAKAGLVGVDIGSSSIKKVAISLANGVPTITSIAIESVSKGVIIDGEVENPSELKARLKSLNLANAKISLGASDSKAGIETIHLDAMLIPTELKQRTLVEAQKISPYPPTDTIYDYVQNGLDLRVAIYRKSKLKSFIDLLEEINIQPKIITTQSLALEKVLPYIIDDLSDDTDLTAIFDIGSSSSMLFIVKGNQIIYTRKSDYGASNLEKMIKEKHPSETIKSAKGRYFENPEFKQEILDPFFETLASSLRQSLQIYSSGKAVKVGNVLITGGIASLPNLSEILSETFDRPVSIADPFKKIKVAENIDASALITNETSYLVAIGLALCKVGDVLNFQPWRIERELELKREYISTLIFVAIFGGLLSMCIWLFANQTGLSHAEANNTIITKIKSMEDRINEIKNVTQDRDDMISQMELVHSFEADRPISVAILITILKSVPTNVYLTDIERDGTVFTFTGKAQDSRSVAEFMVALRKGGWFNKEFLSSFQAVAPSAQGQDQIENTLKELNFPEQNYGEFTVTAELQIDFIKKDLLKRNQQLKDAQSMIVDNTGVASPVAEISTVEADPSGVVPQETQQINKNDVRSQVGQFN